MNEAIIAYNEALAERDICNKLALIIDNNLKNAESKIWHAHPVWFIKGNPIVGYSKQKKGIRLMFWSGADFDELALNILGVKFKDASIFYLSSDAIDEVTLKRCLEKSERIQWDYKNLIKNKGQLLKL